MTFVNVLERIGQAQNPKFEWQSLVPAKDRVEASKAIKTFILQHGILHSNYVGAYTYPREIETFYSFPPFASSSPPLKSKKNLIKIYKFFFEAEKIEKTFGYE